MEIQHCVSMLMFCSQTSFATLMLDQARKLVFTAADRSISYYEANRGSYELSGRVYASGTMGVPQSLTLVTNDSGAAECSILSVQPPSCLLLHCIKIASMIREWFPLTVASLADRSCVSSTPCTLIEAHTGRRVTAPCHNMHVHMQTHTRTHTHTQVNSWCMGTVKVR
jgi:hypothetical protein